MKIALQYLNNVFLFDFKNIIKDEAEGSFFSNNYTYYISSKDGKIHKIKTEENIIYYIDNDIVYFITNLYKNETLQNFLNGIYNIKEVIKENLKNFKVDDDFSDKTSSEISEKLKEMLAKKEIEWEKEKEEKEKTERERIEKIELEEEKKRQEKIKIGIENIKNDDFIDAETFEILLKEYNITIHIRTLHWIRKSLAKIKNGNYTYSGNRSEKTFDHYNELKKMIETN